MCRSLLDGIDDDGEGELQSRVTEGRCTGKKNVVRYAQSILLHTQTFFGMLVLHFSTLPYNLSISE